MRAHPESVMHPRFRRGLVFVPFLLVSAAGADARAQVPHVLGYQGRLLRADGTAATGTASVTFSIHDAASGGSLLWTESQTLGLSDGYYATFLGLDSAVPDTLFDGATRWLQVAVGTEILSPRQQMGAVSYALVAQKARSVSGPADVTSLKVAGQTVVDAGGRLVGAARYTAGAGISIDANQAVSLQSCAAGQSLVRDAASWQCAPAGTVTQVDVAGPLSISNPTTTPRISLAQAGADSAGYLSSTDWVSFDAKLDSGAQCGGDLSGTLPAPRVTRLQSFPVATSVPADGQVLKWNGAAWAPAVDADSHGTVTGLTGHAPLAVWNGSSNPEISLGAASPSSDGYLSSTDWTRFEAKYGAATVCTGDLSGSYASPQVARIQGVPVASGVPAAAQVLRFDGADWAPASLGIADVGGLSSGYLDLTGSQTIGGAKTFTAAPAFGSALATSSGGTGATAAAPHAVFAGPSAGAADAPPAFRALAPADIPAGISITGSAGSVAWSGVSGTPTTLAGYGITDAFPAGGALSGLVRSTAAGDSYFTGGDLGIGTAAPATAFGFVGGPTLHLSGAEPSVRLQSTGGAGGDWEIGLDQSVDRLNFAKNGAGSGRRVVIDAAGNVGIGASVPAARLVVDGVEGTNFGDSTSAGLLVSGAGHNRITLATSSSASHQVAYQLRAGTDTAALQMTQGIGTLRVQTGGADRVGVTAAGDVGVGTLSPGAKLDVRGNLSLPPRTVGTATINAYRIEVVSYQGTSYRSFAIASSDWSADLPGTTFTVSATDAAAATNGTYVVRGFTDAGGGAGWLHSTSTAGGHYGGEFGVTLTMLGRVSTGTLVVSDAVGIGTTSPSGTGITAATSTLGDSPLRLVSTTNFAAGKGNPIVSMDFNGNNYWYQGAGNSIAARIQAQGGDNTYGDRGQLAFFTGYMGGSPALYQRMLIDFDGNVGIGTASPGGQLDVAGNLVVKSSGAVTMPNRPFFHVRNSGYCYYKGTAIKQTGTFSVVSNVGSAGTTSPNIRFTAPVAGVYKVGYWHLLRSVPSPGWEAFLSVYLNGAFQRYWGGVTNITPYASYGAEFPMYLAANDYVEPWIHGGTSGNCPANEPGGGCPQIAQFDFVVYLQQ